MVTKIFGYQLSSSNILFLYSIKKETHLILEQHEGSDGDNFFWVNYRFNVLIIFVFNQST